MIDRDQQVAYMLARAIGICLTDTKPAISGGASITFEAALTARSFSRTFFLPLTFLFHYVRRLRSFERNIVARAEAILATGDHSTANQSDEIDWDLTFAARRMGKKDILYRTDQAGDTSPDAQLLAFVAAEVFMHCAIVATAVEESGLHDVAVVAEITSRLSGRVRLLRERLIQILHAARSSLLLAEAEVSKLSESFRRCLRHEEWAGSDPVDRYRRHSRECFHQLPIANWLGALHVWRDGHFAVSDSINNGARYTYQQARADHYLFELWCFAEIAHWLKADGSVSLIQTSLLRKRGDAGNFLIDRHAEAFYNFYGDTVSSDSGKKVLKLTHVEWFIRNASDFSKSTVLDTKYKVPASEDHLTVLGYRGELGVDRCVVLFPVPLEPRLYAISDATDRLAIVDQGGGRIFAAATLVPDPRALEANRDTIAALVRRVVLAP